MKLPRTYTSWLGVYHPWNVISESKYMYHFVIHIYLHRDIIFIWNTSTCLFTTQCNRQIQSLFLFFKCHHQLHKWLRFQKKMCTSAWFKPVTSVLTVCPSYPQSKASRQTVLVLLKVYQTNLIKNIQDDFIYAHFQDWLKSQIQNPHKF